MADYTEHYQLHQWEPEDSFLRTDFNEDHEKIDTALNGLAEQNAALEAALALCGNCQIYTTSHTGTGTYGEDNPCTLTFPVKPMLAMFIDINGFVFTTAGAGRLLRIRAGSSEYIDASWSEDGKTMTWYSKSSPNVQMNASGRVYPVIVWCIKDPELSV